MKETLRLAMQYVSKPIVSHHNRLLQSPEGTKMCCFPLRSQQILWGRCILDAIFCRLQWSKIVPVP